MAELNLSPLPAQRRLDSAAVQMPAHTLAESQAAASCVPQVGDSASVRMLAQALTEIASEAAQLRFLLLKSVRNSKPAPSASVAQIEKIGFLADKATRAVGRGCFQPAEDWVLSPRLQDLLAQVKEARHG